MTRRFAFFMLFIVIAGLLAPAGFASGATVSYYGLSFDGVDDYVSMPTSVISNTTPSTVLIFLRWNGPRDNGSLTIRYQEVFGQGATYNFLLGIGDGFYTGKVVWRQWKPTYYQVTSTTTLRAGSSAMIGFRYDGSSTLDLIVNGQVDGSGAIEPFANPVSLLLAGTVSENARFWGKIYLVLAYNRALSDAEIQAIYADPLHPPTDGLVLFYAPDSVDPATNTWKDLSGNGNDGTIYGATYVQLRPVSESEPSAESPYELDFDGVGSYVQTQTLDLGQYDSFTIVTQVIRSNESREDDIFSNSLSGDNLILLRLGNFDNWQQGYAWVYFGDSGAAVRTNTKIYANKWYQLAVTGDYATKTITWYVNGKLDSTATYSAMNKTTPSVFYIGRLWGAFANIKIAYLLVYARALNSTEIRQIYEHPNNPPLDGLVLWYSPYTYDPSTGKWLNRAPIFPTIPLCEELDGTNYGAEAVRVSIPSASYYNAVNSSPIPVENVSVAMTHNNTTIGLIPSFLTLPWNQTVTLNVSAVGYESRTLSILTTINSLAVYLIPAPSNGTTTSPPNWTNNFTMPDINGTGWSGWQIGKEALSLNFDKAIQMFFTENPNSQAQAFLPFAIWIGMTILGLVFSQSPLVALTLGVITQASLAGLGAKVDMRLLPGVVTLYLFLFIWILKDFIESRKAD